jgi:hypothetical protein
LNEAAAFLLNLPLLPRWTLANMLGWGLGMLLGGLLLNTFGGILGVIVAGALTGACLGATQWTLLRQRRWILLSALGGGLATIPAYIAGLTLIAGPLVGYFVVGAVYGGVFGTLQWLALRADDEFGLWIIANVIAGGCCGCLTMSFNPLGLPLFCSIGPLVFGLITGRVLKTLLRDSQDFLTEE